MKLSIIIINYKSLKLTEDCLDSIRKNSPLCDYEVIVVDNDSGDGSYEVLAEFYGSWAHVVESGRNGGFSYGNNVGARLAVGDYLFFLNADTVLKPSVLDEMIAFMDSRGEYGVLTCQSVNSEGVSLNNGHAFPSVKSMVTELFVRPFVPMRVKGLLRDYKNKSARELVVDRDWVSGSGLLISSQLFWEIGGWDETYFMYMEDVSLCHEAVRVGKKCGVYSKVGFVHYLGTGAGSAKVVFEASKSEVEYARKYLPSQARLIRLLTTIRARQKLRGVDSSVRADVLRRLRKLEILPRSD